MDAIVYALLGILTVVVIFLVYWFTTIQPTIDEESPPHPEPVKPPEPPAPAASTPAYLGNANTMEIHDLSSITPACQIERMNEKNKVYFDNIGEAIKAMESNGYNGCRWCLSQYHTD